MSKSKQNQNEIIDTLAKATKKLDLNSDKQTLDESVEEYTPKELEYLDKYQEYSKGLFEDEDLYDIILRSNFDEVKIKRELDDMLKMMKKGEEYSWKKVEKGKSKKKFINLAVKTKEVQPKPEIKVTQKNYNKQNKRNYKDTKGYKGNTYTQDNNKNNKEDNEVQGANDQANYYEYDNYNYNSNYNRNKSYNGNYETNYYNNKNYNRGGYYKPRGRGRSTRYYDRYTEEVPNYSLQIKEVGTVDTNEDAKNTRVEETNTDTQQVDMLKDLQQFTEKPLEVVVAQTPNETLPKQSREEPSPSRKIHPKSPVKSPANKSLMQENIFNQIPTKKEEPVTYQPLKQTQPKKMEFSISNSNFDIVKSNPKQFSIAKESNVFHAQTKQSAPAQTKPKSKVENIPNPEYQMPYIPMPMFMYPNATGGEQQGYPGAYPQMFYYMQPGMMQPDMGEDMKNKKSYQGNVYSGGVPQPGSVRILMTVRKTCKDNPYTVLIRNIT